MPPKTACGMVFRKPEIFPISENTIAVMAAMRRINGLVTLVRENRNKFDHPFS